MQTQDRGWMWVWVCCGLVEMNGSKLQHSPESSERLQKTGYRPRSASESSVAHIWEAVAQLPDTSVTHQDHTSRNASQHKGGSWRLTERSQGRRAMSHLVWTQPHQNRPRCCHGDRQASLPPVYVVAVGHTVTQQPSWSSAQILAPWLRALLALASPLSGLELGVEATYRDRGTAEPCLGLPASSRVCETLSEEHQ